MLPRGEYLDDLLWVWGISKDKKGLQYIDVGYLEQKIMEIAESIFGTIDGITVYMFNIALQKKGYSREEALRWIDKIRKYGMESSFLQDEDITVEELQGRIKRVLKALEK